eukprot:TRINITY_DN7035_c0_g2_i8.p1 TRINITY_DN7035_c0_g2~~TRINITY_DN7035_c0_g2_i8.p1  ORF type:complete len:382 (-),score=55.41 TRINITY_DN7035_c0_g2_i8:61-1086(-)
MSDEKTSTELLLHDDNGSQLTDLNYNQSQDFNKGWLFYIKNIIRLALANTVTCSCSSIQFFICLYYAGLLDNVKLLDGMSLGFTWSNVTGFSIIFGFCSALDTFVSQYYGMKDYRNCGLTLNRAFAILAVVTVPCILLQFLSAPIFGLVGIDHEVSEYSGNVTRALVPSIILYAPHILLEKFLLSQQISRPQMVIQFVNTALFSFYCHIFVYWLDFGLYGIMAAKAVGELVYVLCIVLYISFSSCCSSSLTAPSHNMFTGWREYLVIAFPSLFMICLEWWGFQVMNLMSGRIGVADLAANAISMNYDGFIFMTCVGIGVSTGTLVGNSIGCLLYTSDAADE